MGTYMEAMRIASRHPVTRRRAEALAEAMRTRAASHIDTGKLFDSIETHEEEMPNGVTKNSVSISRENLTAIEYGGWRDGKFHPGLEIIQGALRDVGGAL